MNKKVITVKFIPDYNFIAKEKRSGYLFKYQDKDESFFIQAKDKLYCTIPVTTINLMVNLSKDGYIFKWE